MLFSDNSIRDIIDIYNNIQQQINYMDVINAKILIKHLGQWIGRMEDKKMAAIEGISSVSNATAATYQTKQAPEVKAPETVSASTSESASPSIASQVVTVNPKDSGSEDGSKGQGKQEKKEQPTNEQIKKAVDDLNKRMKNTSCEFGIHDETNRVTIKIVDKESGNAIKEFPAEETLDMIAKAWELAGLMVDKRL